MYSLTRFGLQVERMRVFIQMTRNGATKDEAFTYIDLLYPMKDEPDEEQSD
jgi:hypothetical protein